MTPAEAIEHIKGAYPDLELIESKTQSSFYLPGRGNSGRVLRIAHSGARPLKRAASSLAARRAGKVDGKHFELALPLTERGLDELIEEEISAADASEPSNWEKTLKSLSLLGGSGTVKEVTGDILMRYPDFADPDNVRKDLVMLSVNDPNRRSYRAHNTMRGGGRPERFLDRLFRVEDTGAGIRYELYDPLKHGVWTGRVVDGKWRLERADATAGDLVDLDSFDPDANANLTKETIARQVAARRGQAKFRKSLLAAYQGQCCISECTIERLLEAAHITPHMGFATDVLVNGLLLRADLHTLFDLGWLRVHPQTLAVELHPEVCKDPDYSPFDGRKLANAIGHSPSNKALQAHYDANAHHWSAGNAEGGSAT